MNSCDLWSSVSLLFLLVLVQILPTGTSHVITVVGKGNMSNDLMSRGYIMNSFDALGFFIIWLLLLSTSLYGRQYYCMKTM